MSTFNLLKNKTLELCKEICNVMGQSETLHLEKYHAIVREIDDSKTTAFIAPEIWMVMVYNKTLEKLDDLKAWVDNE